MNLISAVLMLVGFAAVVVGADKIYAPLGWLVFGAGLIAVSLASLKRPESKK